jgi:hypothetical protein
LLVTGTNAIRDSAKKENRVETNDGKLPPVEEPLAQLERQLIHAYLAGLGQDVHTLMGRYDDEARKLLAEASLYASQRLSEVEARSHYLRKLRGTE